jgi:hypothetical protein
MMFLVAALQLTNGPYAGAWGGLLILPFILAYALLCLWPFILVWQVIMAALLLFSRRRRLGMNVSAHRRIMALGMLSMVTLILAMMIFHASLPAPFRDFIPFFPWQFLFNRF